MAFLFEKTKWFNQQQHPSEIMSNASLNGGGYTSQVKEVRLVPGQNKMYL